MIDLLGPVVLMPKPIEADFRTLEAEGRIDDRRSLFIVQFGERRCSVGGCPGLPRCLLCSAGVWRFVDGERYADVSVYLTFEVFFIDLRFERRWRVEKQEHSIVRVPSRSEPVGTAEFFTSDEEDALVEALEHRLRGRHGDLMQSLERLPDLTF